jgi:hypothetical protein
MTYLQLTRAAVFAALGLFTLASALPCAAAPKPAFGGTVRDMVGVNIHFTDPQPGEMAMLAGAGFGLIRMDFTWDSTEKQPGVYKFSRYDVLMTNLDKYRVRPLFILDYSNPLYEGGLSPHTDAGRDAFVKWAMAAVAHFKGKRVLWELWNEPNGGFWNPHPNADDYALLAVAVGKAMQEHYPDETYIGPATSGVDTRFMETCFKAGALNYWSAVSCHPYRSSAPDTVISEYERVAALIAKYAPAGKSIPIISGEWGYTVIDRDTNTYSHVHTDALQAQYFDREILTNIANGVPVSIWYDWRNDGPNADETESNFGLVRNEYFAGRDPVYDPKPSYAAAKALLGTIGAYAFSGTVPIPNSTTAHVCSFVHKTEHRWAAWTSSDAAESVVLPIPSGKYDVLDINGAVTGTLTADAAGLPVTLTGDPQFIVRHQ